jgi:nucleoside-diphosphate-sugar epimerase
MPCTPIGAYAESKFAAEKSVLAASQRGLQGTVLRLGTVFGQAVNMRFDAVANHFAYLVGVGRPISVYGSGKQTRPLLHISDASAAIRFCLSQSETTCDQPLNVVGENVSILHLVETLKTLNPTIAVHYTEQHQKSHLSFAVNSQRFQALGWRPATSLQAGLADMLTHWTSFRSLAAGVLDF